MKPYGIGLLFLIAAVFAGCKAPAGETSPAPETEESTAAVLPDEEADALDRVLEAMFTCPDEELLRPEALTVIGLGVEEAPNQEQVDAANAAMEAAWEERIGDCFLPQDYRAFLNAQGGIRLTFQTDAVLGDFRITPVQAERGDLVNRTQDVTVTLRLEPEGAEARECRVVCQAIFSAEDESLLQSLKVTDMEEYEQAVKELTGE